MESDAFIYVSLQAAWFSIVRTVSPQFEDKAGKNAGNDRAGGDCNYSLSSEKWSLTLFIKFFCSYANPISFSRRG